MKIILSLFVNFYFGIIFVDGLTCATGGGFKEKESSKDCNFNDNFCIQLSASGGRQTKEVQACSFDTPTFTSLGVKCNSSGTFHIVHNGIYIDYNCCNTNLCNVVKRQQQTSAAVSYSILYVFASIIFIYIFDKIF